MGTLETLDFIGLFPRSHVFPFEKQLAQENMLKFAEVLQLDSDAEEAETALKTCQRCAAPMLHIEAGYFSCPNCFYQVVEANSGFFRKPQTEGRHVAAITNNFPEEQTPWQKTHNQQQHLS